VSAAGGERNVLVALGAVAGAISVAAGAFGAHALADVVTPERVATFRTGATYGLVHSLAAVAAGLARPAAGRFANVAGWLFLAGVLLFSGSLYALVLLDAPALGAVTPFGGAAFIAGWLALGHGAYWRNRAIG
jgi:uncharacterized membrane protein YgdD (TMEM256/DUF423 family)